MSLGLPAHLAPLVVRRAFTSAQHTFAATVLAIGLVALLALQTSHLNKSLYLAALVMLPCFGLLFVPERDRNSAWAIGFLLLGGIGLFFASRLMLQNLGEDDAGKVLVLTCFSLALIMVAGNSRIVAGSLLWTTIGFCVAEIARQLGRISVGIQPRIDLEVVFAFAVLLVVIPLISHVHKNHYTAQPEMHRAVQLDQMAEVMSQLELKSTALMHDTILSHLSAIANSTSDELDPKFQSELRRDVDAVSSDDWLSGYSQLATSSAAAAWQQSPLGSAIRDCVATGLQVHTTGDLSVTESLDREVQIALALAVKQCLINVQKHSGTSEAEIGAFGSQTEVVIMVIDHGKGFVESDTDSGRLGLRSSVRKRMEQVGAETKVWSTPGIGTSITITVPIKKASGNQEAKPARLARSKP